jgi:hypothetical protein
MSVVPIGRRLAYFEFSSRTGICLSCSRALAPRRERHSSMITPRSLSISAGSNVTCCAQSSSTSNARSRTSIRSVGTCSMYTVSSKLVKAFTLGPKRMPIDSMNDTISRRGKFFVPLNAMCSTKWARPRWSSSSSTEPAFTTSRSSARFCGRALRRT